MTDPPQREQTDAGDRASKRYLTGVLLEAGWLLVAILVPLSVNLWARQPFDPPRAALFRSLVWVMAGLWLFDGLLRRRPPWRELQGNPLLWPLLALICAQVLATILAADRGLSLWGSYERAQGLLTLLSYALLFLVVSARLRTLDRARRLVAAMVAAAVPLVALGLAQAGDWDPAGLVTDARSPVYATLGRSNFLGAYLAMLLPLTLALTLAAHQRWSRLAGGALLLGEVVVIGLTLARGAWLAASTALALFGLVWLWPRFGPKWRRAAPAAKLAALATGLAALAAGLASPAGGFALALISGTQGGSAAARLAIWRATLALIARRPLLGYGPDGLEVVFPGVYPPELVYYQGRGLLVDRAHNLFLDWAVTSGVLGLLAGLSVLAAFFLAGWRVAARTGDAKRRLLLVACLAAVGGNVAGNLVGFDVTATAAATWLLMALAVALAIPRERISRDVVVVGPSRPSLSRWAVLGLALLAVGTIGIATAQANVRPVAADVAARIVDERAAAGDWLAAIEAGEHATALWPLEPVHRLALSWACLEQAQLDGEDAGAWLQRAEAELLAASDLRPGDFRIWAALGELYGVWGNRWDGAKLPLAHRAYQRATVLAPHQATLYTAWGMVELGSGRLYQAADRFRQAVDLDATDGYAFGHLGDVELAAGHVDEALSAYQQAVHWEPELSFAHLGLARCYLELGQPEAAAAALDRALQLDPGSAAALALRQETGGAW
jgi:O-antigen ligase/tetratricopeptide (TPR) repeat protein